MSVLSRSALEASPLADLHAIASELGIDGFRRLRKADLVDAILDRQGGERATAPPTSAEPTPRSARARRAAAAARRAPRTRRATRRRRRRDARPRPRTTSDATPRADAAAAETQATTRRGALAPPPTAAPDGARRPRRAARRDGGDRDGDAEDSVVEGVVELLGNGSGFVRVNAAATPPTTTSTSPPRRCAAASSSPATASAARSARPRRSERYPSLVRVDTINGQPADEVAEGTHFDDLPCAFPTERFALGGRGPDAQGDRVPRADRPRLARRRSPARPALGQERGAAPPGRRARRRGRARASASCSPGARPEELAEWKAGRGSSPSPSPTLAASPGRPGPGVERASTPPSAIAARGGHAVVLDRLARRRSRPPPRAASLGGGARHRRTAGR